MVANYNFVVDFARPNKSNTLLVAENDTNSRKCIFTLLFDKAPFDMEGATTALVQAVLPDGSLVASAATILTDEEDNPINAVEFTIPYEMTQQAGNVVMTVQLNDGVGTRITSFEMYIKVRNALYTEDDYIDDDDMAGFRDLLDRARQALHKIEEMVAQESLPNPFPLRINVDYPNPDPDVPFNYEYTGEEAVDLVLGEIAYLSEIYGSVDVTEDDSAAAQAVAAAEAAAESADSAEEDAGDAAQSLQAMIDLTDNFISQIPTVVVEKDGHTTTITITDREGSTSASIEDGVVGNRWFSGMDFSGNTSGQTGVAGNIDDYYINPVEGKVYKCVLAGDEFTALWDYVFTMSGGGGATEWGNIGGVISDQTDLMSEFQNYYTKTEIDAQEKPLAKNAGSKTWTELITNSATYLVEANVNKFYRLSTEGAVTTSNESLFVSGIVDGEHFSADSHIAVVEESAGVYKYDYFGGGIEPEVYFESTANSLTYTFTHDAITADSVIMPFSSIVGDKYTNIAIGGTGNHTCTVTMASTQSRTVRIYVK